MNQAELTYHIIVVLLSLLAFFMKVTVGDRDHWIFSLVAKSSFKILSGYCLLYASIHILAHFNILTII